MSTKLLPSPMVPTCELPADAVPDMAAAPITAAPPSFMASRRPGSIFAMVSSSCSMRSSSSAMVSDSSTMPAYHRPNALIYVVEEGIDLIDLGFRGHPLIERGFPVADGERVAVGQQIVILGEVGIVGLAELHDVGKISGAPEGPLCA